ncbi:hypothetical protein Nmel_000808 [Mimus melanotis]
MGKALSKEEQAMLNRAAKYDPEVLKRLLRWAQERGFFATLRSVFGTLEWERLGITLWNVLSDGSKETKGLSMTWKLIITVLKQLKEERTAAAGGRSYRPHRQFQTVTTRSHSPHRLCSP